jgi:Transcriptional regulator
MEKQIISRKDSLIMTAIDIVNELGIQGLSIREVAQRQNISTAAIFSHYKSKNDLIIAMLDYYVKYDIDIYHSVKERELRATDAILYYIELYYSYYENYPAITAIMFTYEYFNTEPILGKKVKDTLQRRTDNMIEFVKRAQSTHEIKDDIEADMLADIILGAVRIICLRWRMNGYSFSLKDRVFKSVQKILESVSSKEGGEPQYSEY